MKFCFVLMLLIFSSNTANSQLLTENKSKLICSIEHGLQICTEKDFMPYTGVAFALYPNGNLSKKVFYQNLLTN